MREPSHLLSGSGALAFFWERARWSDAKLEVAGAKCDLRHEQQREKREESREKREEGRASSESSDRVDEWLLGGAVVVTLLRVVE